MIERIDTCEPPTYVYEEKDRTRLPDGIVVLCFYPMFATVLPDRSLRVSTSGVLDCGEKFDGSQVISANHQFYAEWLDIATNRLALLDKIHHFEPEIHWPEENPSERRIATYDRKYPGEPKCLL